MMCFALVLRDLSQEAYDEATQLISPPDSWIIAWVNAACWAGEIFILVDKLTIDSFVRISGGIRT